MEPFVLDDRKEARRDLAMEEIEEEVEEKNLRGCLTEFTEATSIHGMKNAFTGGKRRLTRTVWTALVMVAVGALILILFQLFRSYSQRPFKTVVTVTPTELLPFPAVTICNVNGMEVSYSKMSKLRAQDTAKNNVSAVVIALSLLTSLYRDRVNDTLESVELNFSPELLDMTFRDVSQRAFASLNDTMINCFWDGQEEDCADLFHPMDLDKRRCFQFNADTLRKRRVSRMSGQTSGLEVLMNVRQEEYVFNKVLSAGAQVILHEPGEMPDTENKGFLAAPGFSIMGRIKVNKFHYLPAPFKAFGDDSCTNNQAELTSRLPLNSAITVYSHALCRGACLQQLTQARCRCCLDNTSYSDADAVFPLCTIRDAYVCYFVSYANFSRWSWEQQCTCPRRCDNTEYVVSISTAYFPSDVALNILHKLGIMDKNLIRKNFIDLKIFYDDLVTSDVRHVPEFTVGSILGTVGGQMGLFIGASLLSLAEVFHLLLTLGHLAVRAVCCRMQRHVSPRGKQ